jgi:Recombinase
MPSMNIVQPLMTAILAGDRTGPGFSPTSHGRSFLRGQFQIRHWLDDENPAISLRHHVCYSCAFGERPLYPMKKLSACPSWLDLSEDRSSFVYVPEKAEIVRRIFELSIGGLGSYSIAKKLDRQNVPPFTSSPNWDHTTIDSILRNRATVGEHQPKSYAGGSKKGVPVGLPISGYYPAVIDESTFQAAQEARQRHLAVGRGRKGNDLANVFGGLTTCGYCGEAVRFHSNGSAKSLICARVLEGRGCFRVGWSYKNFEQSVFHFLCHPALRDTQGSSLERAELTRLVEAIRHLPVTNPLDPRLEIASKLKGIVSELKLLSAGKEANATLPGSLIRRDQPGRLFAIRLWQGPSYEGLPVP